MILGIRRRETAEESSDVFFRTTKLITSHFRRDSDKQMIYDLCGRKNTLSNLLIASSSVHAYHYLGIHVIDTVEAEKISVENIKEIEKIEKNEIFKEISSLIKNSIRYEINLLKNGTKISEKIINKITDITGEISNSEIEKFRKFLEDQILTILHEYPTVYMIDYAGDLTGYTNVVRSEIINRSSKLKIISKEIEKALIEEGNENKYIELSLLKNVKRKIMEDFEFESFKELEMEAIPMRMLITKILNNLFNLFPTSKRALKSFDDALKFKKKLISKFEEANDNKTDYEEFEKNIIKSIENKIKEICILDRNPNSLIYFLEALSEKNFSEIMELLNKLGVTNIPDFVNIINLDKEVFKQFLKLNKVYGIKKIDFVRLSNPFNNPIFEAEVVLRALKLKIPHLDNSTLIDLVKDPNGENLKIIKQISVKIGKDEEDFLKIYRKKQIIREKLFKIVKVSNYSSLVLFLEHNDILMRLSREIFFTLFSKISRQISRVLETYIKVKEDKSLYLLGIKHIFNSVNQEKWIAIKIEELIIERIMNRQKELSTIFDAVRNPFLVNGFILARFVDEKLSESEKSFREEPSTVYNNIASLPLPKDMISPVSYCISYDLLQRFKSFYEKRLLQIETATNKEKLRLDKKKKEIRKAQESNTFNWIERKITSSIMRITSKGINPTTLYWNSTKDTSICSDNIKLHSEIPGDNTILERFTDFYFFAVSRMKKLWPQMKSPDYGKLKSEIYEIIAQEMIGRIGSKPTEEIIEQKIIEGDRWNVANRISSLIGKRLDKILYKKFKKSLK